jgi:NADP-dependent aldehyde dehydrogenase
MSSINPVVLLPGALAAKTAGLAKEFVGSLTLGTGQFCTNPGFLLALAGPELDQFIAAAADALKQVVPSVMLTAGIHAAYESRVDQLLQHSHVTVIGRGDTATGTHCGRAALFAVDAAAVLQRPEIAEEVFGPSSVIVRCKDEAELLNVIAHLEGQLTATLHFVDQDINLARSLLAALEGKVGRLVANSWPTGVEVSHAMVHGGPYPATSDGRSTSVGTLAIERFLRPVCYQDFPDSLLPAPLRSGAVAAHPHRYDGEYRLGAPPQK